MNRTNKRIGKWSWALSADERLTAAAVGRSQSEQTGISRELKRKYDAMLAKQEKLLARAANGPNGSNGSMARGARRA